MNKRFTHKADLKRILCISRLIIRINDKADTIEEFVKLVIDIKEYKKEFYAYVLKEILDHDLILDLLWL